MKTYDIFISYRRDAYESANLIATRLRAAGYRVFFDLESMRSGLFNEQLFDVIDKCKDVVAVLPPGALDRCSNHNDWVRMELLYAMEKKKNIIPVMLNGFQWPEPMPEGMEVLSMYQAVTSSRDFFDLSMERLEGYLQSKKYTVFRKTVKRIFILLAAAVGVCLIFLAFCNYLAKPVCRQIAEYMTARIGEIDILMGENMSLTEIWDNYSPDRADEFSVISKNIDYQTLISKGYVLDLTGWQSFLAGLYGVSSSDMETFDTYVNSFYDDIRYNMENMQDAVSGKEPLLPSVKNIHSANLEIFMHSANALYYSYLQIINGFPDDSQDIYRKLARKFSHMPKTGLGLHYKEYDVLVEQENTAMERLFGQQERSLASLEDEAFVAGQRCDSLGNEVLGQYRSFIAANCVNAANELWQNWNCVCMAASFLDMAIEDAVDGGGPLSPDLVWKDLEKMLAGYLTLYPESEPYVISVRQLYREAMEGSRNISGVLVYAFAQGHVSQTYRLGDILISCNGKAVSSLDELKKAYSASGNGKIRLMRLEDGLFKERTVKIEGEEDFTGFCNVKIY
ncbi:MAG: TIR domain-containing protein [Bacteroidales bacterium]|nr:TIR domain-containing protein [Bacteroidales bacterium]